MISYFYLKRSAAVSPATAFLIFSTRLSDNQNPGEFSAPLSTCLISKFKTVTVQEITTLYLGCGNTPHECSRAISTQSKIA